MTDTPTFSHRRLQREADFTGGRLTSFKDVFVRHGLPGLGLALLLLVVPDLQSSFVQATYKAAADPVRYVIWAMVILTGMSLYALRLNRRFRVSQLGWIVYLGALSFWEEWVFRIAVPHLLQGVGAPYWGAALVSAFAFGGLHYFTLRWKWQWCVGASVGSLALSRQFALHDDLLLIAAFHWIATYLNTPRLPGQFALQASD